MLVIFFGKFCRLFHVGTFFFCTLQLPHTLAELVPSQFISLMPTVTCPTVADIFAARALFLSLSFALRPSLGARAPPSMCACAAVAIPIRSCDMCPFRDIR